MKHKKTQFIIILSVLLIACCFVSCASVEDGSSPSIKKSLFSHSKVRKGYLMNGTSREECYFNDYQLVGILMEGNVGMDSLELYLRNLELEWDNDSTSTLPTIDIGWTQTVFFNTFRKTNNKRFADQDCEALNFLRDKYWDHFGMGVYFASGKILGVLKNDLVVSFERRTEKEKIEKLMKSYGARRIIPRTSQDSERYYVEFPDDWGYKIIDLGDELFKLNEVISVTHQYQTIESPT